MKFKRLAALLLAFLLLANSAVAFAENGPDPAEEPDDAAGAFLEKPDSYTVEGVTYPYLRQLANTEPVEESEMTLYFVNGGDIPYVSLEDYAAFLSELLAELNKGDIEYRVQAISDALFLISRDDNASTLYIDTEEDSLYFLNMNGFTQKVGSRAAVTIMDLPEVDLPDVEEMADFLRMFSDILGGNPDIDLAAEIGEAEEEDFTDLGGKAFRFRQGDQRDLKRIAEGHESGCLGTSGSRQLLFRIPDNAGCNAVQADKAGHNVFREIFLRFDEDAVVPDDTGDLTDVLHTLQLAGQTVQVVLRLRHCRIIVVGRKHRDQLPYGRQDLFRRAGHIDKAGVL